MAIAMLYGSCPEHTWLLAQTVKYFKHNYLFLCKRQILLSEKGKVSSILFNITSDEEQRHIGVTAVASKMYQTHTINP